VIRPYETSPIYCQNRSEIQLGLALRGIRDKAYSSTKNGIPWKGEDEGNIGIATRNSNRKDFKNSLLESVWKLGTDRVDFYQLHGLTLDKLPIAEAADDPLEVLSEAKEELGQSPRLHQL
jgi:aryl-alcohol dehydrogenase-like predicted oxidoreductase